MLKEKKMATQTFVSTITNSDSQCYMYRGWWEINRFGQGYWKYSEDSGKSGSDNVSRISVGLFSGFSALKNKTIKSINFKVSGLEAGKDQKKTIKLYGSKLQTFSTSNSGADYLDTDNLLGTIRANFFGKTRTFDVATSINDDDTVKCSADLFANLKAYFENGYGYLVMHNEEDTPDNCTLQYGNNVFTPNYQTFSKWEITITYEDQFLIVYNANGGSNAPSSFYIEAGAEWTPDSGVGVSAPIGHTPVSKEVTITEDGETYIEQYLYWNTSPNGSGSRYVGDTTYLANENLILYAEWLPKNYEVSFDPNGGKVTMSSQIHTYNKSHILPANRFTRSHVLSLVDGAEQTHASYPATFDGWTTSSIYDGFGTKYSNNQTVVNLSAGQNIILYAQWLFTEIELKTGLQQNKTFMGWSRDPNATVPEFYTGDIITISSDTVLYAVYREGSIAKDNIIYVKINDQWMIAINPQ